MEVNRLVIGLAVNEIATPTLTCTGMAIVNVEFEGDSQTERFKINRGEYQSVTVATNTVFRSFLPS
jgi:hypothetical protein